MVLANRYFKDVGSTQTSIFGPNTVFHSLHYSQKSLRTSVYIRVIKSGVLTMLIQKICHKGLLHLQKIVSQPFSANREPHTAIANLNIQKWHVYDHGCQSGKETSAKKLCFHKEKD